MSDVTIVDSGFVYALLDSDDRYHSKALSLITEPRWDFRVPTVIFVEVFHNRIRDAIAKDRKFVTEAFAKALPRLLNEYPFRLEEITPSDLRRTAELLYKYADSGIDYVDAVVIALAERFGTVFIMTTDQADFRRYVPSFADSFFLPIFDT